MASSVDNEQRVNDRWQAKICAITQGIFGGNQNDLISLDFSSERRNPLGMHDDGVRPCMEDMSGERDAFVSIG